jgi:hypothetical protein
MIIATTVAALALSPAPAQASRWVATVRPDVQVINEVDPNFPLRFWAVKFKYPAEGMKLEARLANDNVYSKMNLFSRENVREMAQRTGALVAINADFFGNDGDPLGTMLSGGEIVSEPYAPRSVAAWSPTNGLQFDSPSFSASIEPVGAPRIRIDGINRSVRAGEIVLFTQKGGVASSKQRCSAFLLEMKQPMPVTGSFSLRLKTIVHDLTDIPVALDEAILMVSPQRLSEVTAALYAGLTYDFRINLSGQIDWKAVTDAIGGGPRLVKNGVVSVTRDYERFDASYANRHPRSAIGYTANREVVFLAVDGRSSTSKGLTLDELAKLMVKLGCVDAMNLDGGGSTTLVLGGAVLNRPSDGGLRGVANALLLHAPQESIPIGIQANSLQLKPGDVTTLKVVDGAGTVVPQTQVVWTSSGSAGWVGGDGAFRATDSGKATVRAFARGTWASAEVAVAP